MVTDYPQQLAATSELTPAGAAASGLVARTFSRIGQALCGLSGHDTVLHFEGKRVMMRCTSCGHDTPGWDVSGHGPRRRFEGDARRHELRAERRLALRKTA